MARVLALCVALVSTAAAMGRVVPLGTTTSRGPARIEVLEGQTRNQGPAPVDIRFDLSTIDVDPTPEGFHRVHATGLSPLNEVGKPDLPTAGVLLAVGPGYEPVLEIAEHAHQTIAATVPQPCQRNYRCHTVRPTAFEFASELYASNQTYPANAAEVQEVGSLQGLRLVRIALHPLRADFAQKAVEASSHLKVRVRFQKTASATARVRLSPAQYELARTIVGNPRTLDTFAVRATGAEILWVVSADQYVNLLKDWVNWKRSKGLSVEVITRTAAGSTNDAVKTFLTAKYKAAATKPSYLLFVGNKDTMPPFMEDTSSGAAASDWRYSLLSGASDHIPDVNYGRLAADNEAEVQTQLQRWMKYEQAPDTGAWFNQGTTIASAEGSNPSDKEYGQQIAAALKAGTYKQVDAFTEGDHTATTANLLQAFNAGRTWVAYIGHGSGTSWPSSNDMFSVSDVDKLQNGGKLPVIIDVACQNGSWVDLDRCFGKAWVTKTNHGQLAGAVGYYGGSVDISWNPPAVMSVGVAKYHFQKPVHTLGATVLAGQLYLFEQMGTTTDTLDNIKWYNLLGDPSLVMRTDTPKAYNVDHYAFAKVADDGGPTSADYLVRATDSAGKAVPGVLVAIGRAGDDPIATATTDTDGRAVLDLQQSFANLSGLSVTTSGYNLETHTQALR